MKKTEVKSDSSSVARICCNCDNYCEARMRCDYAPGEPCPPDCTCDSWTAIEPDLHAKLRGFVKELEGTIGCNCDLDNWEPEGDTGHSRVCRIHKAAKERERQSS